VTTRPRFDSRALALAGLTRDQIRMLESLFKDVDALALIQVVLATANTLFPAGRVLTDTATIDIDTATAGQIKAAVVDGSITTTKLGGDITTAGKALLDDANAAAQLVTLGAMPATTTLDAIPTAVASVEFDQQQALQFVIENRTSDPGSPVPGQLWLRVDL
jgi:hypothetical protein